MVRAFVLALALVSTACGGSGFRSATARAQSALAWMPANASLVARVDLDELERLTQLPSNAGAMPASMEQVRQVFHTMYVGADPIGHEQYVALMEPRPTFDVRALTADTTPHGAIRVKKDGDTYMFITPDGWFGVVSPSLLDIVATGPNRTLRSAGASRLLAFARAEGRFGVGAMSCAITPESLVALAGDGNDAQQREAVLRVFAGLVGFDMLVDYDGRSLSWIGVAGFQSNQQATFVHQLLGTFDDAFIGGMLEHMPGMRGYRQLFDATQVEARGPNVRATLVLDDAGTISSVTRAVLEAFGRSMANDASPAPEPAASTNGRI